MIILGIETSCDETAVSIVEAKGGLEDLHFKLLGSAVNSQVKIHEQYGGVFPTLAKREHIKNLPVVYEQALANAKIKESDIEIIAVTVGPGLEPALWTGINFAQNLSKKLNVPVIPANHMLGHIASVLFKTEANPKSEIRNPKNFEFPAIALLVSGGHTELVLLQSWAEIEKLGETQDDAVGEAFDKVARMLGLPYPGGPEISRLAEQARNFQFSIFNFQSPKFPRPMINSKDLNFSFSGLKTAVLYYLNDLTPNPPPCEGEGGKKGYVRVFPPLTKGRVQGGVSLETKLAVAREFEDAVVETLVTKTKAAIDEHSPKTLIIGGGVIANKALRESFLKLKDIYPDLEVLIPEKQLTTDNATMIAAAGFIEYLKNGDSKIPELRAQGNLDIN